MNNKMIALLVLAVIVIGVGSMSVFTVSEKELAVKFKLGKIVKSDYEPGLHFNIPIVEEVKKYDRRLLSLDAPPARFLTSENKYVLVDAFAKWRIVDPALFFTKVAGNENEANIRLGQIVQKGLRDQFGKRTIQEVVSGERVQIMDIVAKNADTAARELGITVKDVRIKRIDLPGEVSESVFKRMRADREKVAREFRAQGKEEAERIRADADRQRTIILSEAYREAEKLRGEGDASATEIYAKAYAEDAEFYVFYRSLTAYENSFYGGQDFLVLEPDSDFFNYFDNQRKPAIK